jgi:hypothetical protein
MSYKLVQYDEKLGFIVSNFGPQVDLYAAMIVRNYSFQKFEDRACLRPCLQGQPKFNGVLGPMYDGEDAQGEPVIRYECPKAYQHLSA